MSEKVYIFDTTLRDGEQSAGISFTPREKLEIAKQLERLGVDVIEAGFPCTSPGDLAAVKAIAAEVRRPTIAALARAVASDIDTAWEAVREARSPRIHVFINTSDIQIAHQLRKGREQVLEQAAEMVRRAAAYTSDVEFSPMDATRSDVDFLCEIIEKCIDAGATTINIPDSVGYAIPEELGRLFELVRERVSNIDEARLSFHGQNDLGLCTANTLSAIQNGARQVEVTINGIGERAGNTSLEEVVMAIDTRSEFFGLHTDIDPGEIYRSSKLVERLSGMSVQWNKAIVGKNAFRHGSGIHQDGILKLRETWEIMDPKRLGIPLGTQLVLGKLSGRHAFKKHMEELGYELSDAEMGKAFAKFKELADKKVGVDDRDLHAIVADNLGANGNGAAWQLHRVQVTCGDHATPTASLELTAPDGTHHVDAATGDGPIDAVYRAMNRITRREPELTEFRIRSTTEGRDSQGEVALQIDENGRSFAGKAVDTDIIVAAARAYLTALNRLVAASERPAAKQAVTA